MEARAPLTAPVPQSQDRPAEMWIALDRWCKANSLPLPARVEASADSGYQLNTPKGNLYLRAGSRLAYLGGLEFQLGFAPQLIDTEPFVHMLDLAKTIRPLLSGPPAIPPDGDRVIVVDPGHGGENGGAASVLGNGFEKDFTLDWARRLQPLLSSNGWHVFLTRIDDSNPAIPARVAFAQNHRAGLFLSLHFNSIAGDPRQSGLETYCLTPAGMPSTVTRGFEDDASMVYPNNAFDVQNVQLAYEVHRALLRASGGRDRGVRHARFPGVLRGQQRPAILVEAGYLSNPEEARRIAEPAYRQRLAEAVAGALGEP